MATRSGCAVWALLGVVLSSYCVGHAAAGCFTVNAAVLADGTITSGRTGFTPQACDAAKNQICSCRPTGQPLPMPLKVCADSQEAAEVWYETYVLPLLKNNFDGLVTMKGQTTRQQQIDTWSSLDYNATLRTKYQCVPKSTTADGIKTAFCDASFIYMSNGIKACSGGVSDTTCTMGNDCLSLEDKLFEKCSSVYGASMKGRPVLSELAPAVSGEAYGYLRFNGTGLCTYPAMKCFKQAASTTTTLSIKPPFCAAAFDVKNLNVCDYSAERAALQRARMLATAQSQLVTDDDCKKKFGDFCYSDDTPLPTAKCSDFYCTEATLFSDYYNVGESYDHQLSLLLDGYTRKDINPHSFDSLVTPGAIDVQQGMWAASCTDDASCQPASAEIQLPPKTSYQEGIPCCSVYKDVYENICPAPPPSDKFAWETQGNIIQVPPCKNDAPCTPLTAAGGSTSSSSTTSLRFEVKIPYTSDEFNEVKDKFRQAIADALSAPVDAVTVESWSSARRAATRRLLQEDMLKVKVKLLLPESMLAAVKSLLTKDKLNASLKAAGLKEISEFKMLDDSSATAACLRHGHALWLALPALVALVAAAV